MLSMVMILSRRLRASIRLLGVVRIIVLGFLLSRFQLAALEAPQAEVFHWSPNSNGVDADIKAWPLTRLLERIAAKTRWQIYVEPDTKRLVSAKFKGLSRDEALRRLLGDLSYMLIPGTNGAPKLYIFRTTSRAATDLVTAPAERDKEGGEGKPIPNELIVRLKPGSKESIDQLAARLGAKVIGRADDIHAYRLRFDDPAATDSARASLASDTNVSAVDSNYLVGGPDRPDALTAGGLPGIALRPQAPADGSKMIVGLIDTALQTQGTALKGFLLPSVSVAGDAALPSDQPTHGTSMAETILLSLSRAQSSSGTTPVQILPIDVYGSGETITIFEIGKGIYAAIEGGAKIVNMSRGGDGDSSFVHDMIQAGYAQGVIFIGSAGNQPVTSLTYPAAYPEVISVTAIGRDGQLASYANKGNWVEVAAPGTGLVPFQNQTWVVVGTSTSAANVSGVAASLLGSTQKTGTALQALLMQTLGGHTAPPKP